MFHVLPSDNIIVEPPNNGHMGAGFLSFVESPHEAESARSCADTENRQKINRRKDYVLSRYC